MTVQEIKAMVAGPEYEFLRSNPHLGDKIMFLVLGGSYSYGTNVAGSDVDIRGCAVNSPSDILGMSNFEQVVNTETDTTVYSFNKLVSLLMNCNPNTIEMLGCKPEHYILMTSMGKEMVNNRKLFLSQRAVNSFGGYAVQQLRRLENALARDGLPQAKKEGHVCNAMNRSMDDFHKQNPTLPEGITLYVGESKRDDLDMEVFMNANVVGYPARSFKTLLSHLGNVLQNYEKLSHRNSKKDAAHLNKHAMHLIRLYLMCLDILEKGDIITYREADHDLLMSIRRGDYIQEDGLYRPEFYEMVTEYEKRLEYAKENTDLPKHPDMKRVEEFVMDINRKSIDLKGVLSDVSV